MKKRYLFPMVALLLALRCSAYTIVQPWEGGAWTSYRGSGANSSTLITPNVNYSLATVLYRTNANNGAAMIYTNLPTAIPAGTGAGAMGAFWMEADFQITTGSGWNMFIGLFNSSGDNDDSPALNFVGVQISDTQIQARRKINSTQNGSPNVITHGGNYGMYHVLMKIYNEDGVTKMNTIVYSIDPVNFKRTKIASDIGFPILGSGETLSAGLTSFGVHNTIFAGSTYLGGYIDNLYCSNTAENPVEYVPSFSGRSVKDRMATRNLTYFNPWDTSDWAPWYSGSTLIYPFVINRSVTLAPGYGVTNAWSPEAGEAVTNDGAAGLFFFGNTSKGCTFNGNNTFIDVRAPNAQVSLTDLYDDWADGETEIRFPFQHCFFYDADQSTAGTTVISNVWVKGFREGFRAWMGSTHPVKLFDYNGRRNCWNGYVNGANVTVTNCTLYQSEQGALYLGNHSYSNIIRNNSFQDCNYCTNVSFADICMDSTFGNQVGGNTHLTPTVSTVYNSALKLFRNPDAHPVRQNPCRDNNITNNTVNGYSVGFEVGARMGGYYDFDDCEEGRDYASGNLFKRNTFNNTYFGIKVNASGNFFDNNTYSGCTYPMVLDNLFYSLTETVIMNQPSAIGVHCWFSNGESGTWRRWFSLANDLNQSISAASKYTYVSTDGSAGLVFYSAGVGNLKVENTLLSNNQITPAAASTMKDVYASGGVPIDIAVGEFWKASPGDEIAVIWDTPTSNIMGTNYYTINIYDSDGIEIYRCGRSLNRWETIAAGDFFRTDPTGDGFDLGKTEDDAIDEIAAASSSPLPIIGLYPIYIFTRGEKDPIATGCLHTSKWRELAAGNFDATDICDEVAAIDAATTGDTNISFYDPVSGTNWVITGAANLMDIAAGDFDDNDANGDEVAGRNDTSSYIYFYRSTANGSYATAGTSTSQRWRAMGSGQFDTDTSNDEVVLGSTTTSSGVYKMYYYRQGATTAYKTNMAPVQAALANSIAGGSFPATATMGPYEKKYGTYTYSASTIDGWGDYAVMAPSAAQTTAIPLFLLKAQGGTTTNQYLKVTPIVR